MRRRRRRRREDKERRGKKEKEQKLKEKMGRRRKRTTIKDIVINYSNRFVSHADKHWVVHTSSFLKDINIFIGCDLTRAAATKSGCGILIRAIS